MSADPQRDLPVRPRAVDREESQLGPDSLAIAAFGEAIEQIPGAVWLVDTRGNVVHMNTVASREFARSFADTTAALKSMLRGATVAETSMTKIEASGLPAHWLIVRRPSARSVTSRLDHLRVRHTLTPRQADVLAVLAEGCSNAAIAARLGCSVKTVELHVTALFNAMNVASRAELVAAFWSEPAPSAQ